MKASLILRLSERAFLLALGALIWVGTEASGEERETNAAARQIPEEAATSNKGSPRRETSSRSKPHGFRLKDLFKKREARRHSAPIEKTQVREESTEGGASDARTGAILGKGGAQPPGAFVDKVLIPEDPLEKRPDNVQMKTTVDQQDAPSQAVPAKKVSVREGSAGSWTPRPTHTDEEETQPKSETAAMQRRLAPVEQGPAATESELATPAKGKNSSGELGRKSLTGKGALASPRPGLKPTLPLSENSAASNTTTLPADAIPSSASDRPTAIKTGSPGVVKSPYPPYRSLDVRGLARGTFAKDPSTGEIFRLP